MHIPLVDSINVAWVLDFLEQNDGKILFYRFERRIDDFVDTVIDTMWGLFPPQELLLIFEEGAAPVPSLLLAIGQQIQARIEELGIVNVARAFVVTSDVFKSLKAIVEHAPYVLGAEIEPPRRKKPLTLDELEALTSELAEEDTNAWGRCQLSWTNDWDAAQ